MSQTKITNTKFLVECAMMVAIASVLSVLKIVDMPYGGSVTIASMLPIIIISYRYGLANGLTAGLLYGVMQQLLGLKNLGYVSEWYSVIAVILLDYLVAFTVMGFGGIFRGKFHSQRMELMLGALLASVLRFVCHFISGFTVWAGWGVPTGGALVYSLSYNSTYMLPETLVLLLVAWYLGGVLDFTAEQPMRIKQKASSAAAPSARVGMLVLIGGLIADISMIFSKLQSGDSGEWLLDGLKDVKWVNVIVVTALCLVAGIALILYARQLEKKTPTEGK